MSEEEIKKVLNSLMLIMGKLSYHLSQIEPLSETFSKQMDVLKDLIEEAKKKRKGENDENY